jgi:hypothetical protein
MAPGAPRVGNGIERGIAVSGNGDSAAIPGIRVGVSGKLGGNSLRGLGAGMFGNGAGASGLNGCVSIRRRRRSSSSSYGKSPNSGIT